MSQPVAVAPKSHKWARLIIVFVVAFDVAAFWQWTGGAYQSEFGGHPEEGARYVKGLLVRDQIVDSWFTRNVRSDGASSNAGAKFSERFSIRDSVAGEGIWPPGISFAQSAWTLAFGASRLSVLLLVAGLAAGVATMLYGVASEEFGGWAAVVGGLLWLCAALVREWYGMIMPEALGALAMFGAAVAWGRFLDVGRGSDAFWFGILAALAQWTEGSGLAVTLMAGLSLVWTRRWGRLGRWELWVSGAVPVLSMIYVRKRGFEGFDFGAHSVAKAVSFYSGELAFAVGLAVAVFAGAGFYFRCLPRNERHGRWTAIASLVFGVFAYHCVCSQPLEARHVVAAVPGLIMLALAGVTSVGGLMSARIPDPAERRRRDWLWILLLALLVLPVEVLKFRRKEFEGFGAIVRTLIAEAPRGSRIFVSSDATGEGMFISELAMNDRGSGFSVEMGSASLSEPGSRWRDPRIVRERFAEDRELLEYLTSGGVQYVVLDDALPYRQRAGYHDQIRRVLEDNVRSFWPVYESPIVRGGELFGRPAKVFRVISGG